MNEPQKKDALTELVDVAGSQSDDRPENNGAVSAGDGTPVQLGYELGKVQSAVLGVVKAISDRFALEIKIIQEDAERKIKALGKKKTK